MLLAFWSLVMRGDKIVTVGDEFWLKEIVLESWWRGLRADRRARSQSETGKTVGGIYVERDGTGYGPASKKLGGGGGIDRARWQAAAPVLVARGPLANRWPL
jgi:hypothetical protein